MNLNVSPVRRCGGTTRRSIRRPHQSKSNLSYAPIRLPFVFNLSFVLLHTSSLSPSFTLWLLQTFRKPPPTALNSAPHTPRFEECFCNFPCGPGRAARLPLHSALRSLLSIMAGPLDVLLQGHMEFHKEVCGLPLLDHFVPEELPRPTKPNETNEQKRQYGKSIPRMSLAA